MRHVPVFKLLNEADIWVKYFKPKLNVFYNRFSPMETFLKSPATFYVPKI